MRSRAHWHEEELLVDHDKHVASIARHYKTVETWDETVLHPTSFYRVTITDAATRAQIYDELNRIPGVSVTKHGEKRITISGLDTYLSYAIDFITRNYGVVLRDQEEDDVMVRRATSAHGLMLLRSLVPTSPDGPVASMYGYDLMTDDRFTSLTEISATAIAILSRSAPGGVQWEQTDQAIDTCGQRPTITYHET